MLNPYVNPRIIYNTYISLPLATYPVLLDNKKCKNSYIVLVIPQVQAIRSFVLLISGSIFDFILFYRLYHTSWIVIHQIIFVLYCKYRSRNTKSNQYYKYILFLQQTEPSISANQKFIGVNILSFS